jgi:hypothetical protein
MLGFIYQGSGFMHDLTSLDVYRTCLVCRNDTAASIQLPDFMIPQYWYPFHLSNTTKSISGSIMGVTQ